MIDEDRIMRIRERRASTFGAGNLSSDSTDSMDENRLDAIRKERENRLQSVYQHQQEQQKPAEERKPSTELPANNASWWNKTKDFLKQSPMDFMYSAGTKVAPKATEAAANVGQAIQDIPKKIDTFREETRPKLEDYFNRLEKGTPEEKVKQIGGTLDDVRKGVGDILIGKTEEEKKLDEEFSSGKITKEEYAKRLNVGGLAFNVMANVVGGEGELVKNIAKSNSEKTIGSLLKGRVADEEVESLSRVLKHVSNKDDVAKIISDATPYTAPEAKFAKDITDYGAKLRMEEEASATARVNEQIAKERTIESLKKDLQENPEMFDPEKYVAENVKKKESARLAEKGGVWDRVKGVFRKGKSELVDTQSAIEDVLNKTEKQNRMKILASEDYRMQYPKVLRASEQAKDFLQEKGLTDVIKNVDNLDNLEQYLVAKRAIELDGKGIKTGRDIVKDQQLVNAFAEKYEPYAQKVKQYTHDLLDYLQSTGIKSQAQVDALKAEHPNYVPFNRIFDDAEEEFLNRSFGTRANAGLGQQTVIQRIKGSEREVESPFASLFDKTRKTFEQGERNKAGQMMADYHTLPDNPFGLEKIEGGKSPAESTIAFFRNGVKEEWKIAPEYGKAIKNMDAHELGILGKIFAAPVRIFKVGTTALKPSFWLRNIGRDQLTAFINSDNGVRGSILNGKNFMESLYSIIKKDDIYKQIRAEGGSYTSLDYWRNPAFKTVEEVRAGKSVGSKIKYTITHPTKFFRALEDITAKSEELTRAQQGRAAYRASLAKGMTKEEAAKVGAKAYRETTVDFMRSGNMSKTINNVIPYFNPGIQGSRTLIKNIIKKPVSTSAKIVATTMLPMAYVTTWNLSDEKRRAAYEDIPEWEKENNLIFIPPNPTKDESGKWNVIKIPYSQEIAQLTRPVRRIQEQIAGLDPVRFGEVADALFQTATSLNVSSPEGFVSTVAPQALKPTMETFTNKKFYTGGPVVPDNLKDLAPEAQFYTNETKSGQKRTPTSGTIKALASKIGLSPIKTEFWLNETFGGLTANIVNNVDTIASKLGAIKPEEVGGVGFLDSIKASYNKAYGNEGVSKKYQAIDDKIKEISKMEDPEDKTVALQDYISGLPEEERRGVLFNISNKGLSTKGISISEDIIRMKPTYNQVQDLVNQGKKSEAQKVVDSLSEEDYKAYKKVRASATSAKTKLAKVDFKPTFDKIQEMIAQGKKSEAQKVVDKLTDDEYHIYKLLKEAS